MAGRDGAGVLWRSSDDKLHDTPTTLFFHFNKISPSFLRSRYTQNIMDFPKDFGKIGYN